MNERELFLAALDITDPDQRSQFLDANASEPALRQRVDELLKAHVDAGSFLDSPPLDDATGAFTPSPGATSPHSAAEQTGLVIAGRYTLLEKIGEGGMGEVWVAKQSEPVKRKVAIKLIKAGMDSKSVVQRFEQERQALAMMDHPNIARILDGGMTDDRQPYFVMELVNGLPLTRFCDEAKLGIRERLELFVPICQAVQHAHQKAIVHRDLKPSNILVTIVDGRPMPKVIDFGVAKATGGKLTDESMSTQFGAVIGTLEYMSPEQAGFSGADVDTRADIYSLGVILYELLTGLRPFDAKRLKKAAFDEMIRMIREEEPSKPSTRLSTDDARPSLAAVRQTEPNRLSKLLRGELDWVVMKCLEKQRDRRYETANALSRDVQRYLADEAVEARPPSAGYRLRKFAKRNKGRVIAAMIVLFALVGGIVGTSIGLSRAIDAEHYSRDQQKKAQDERDEKESARANEEQARKGLEIELASRQIDDVTTMERARDQNVLLSNLVRLLPTLPEHANALRSHLKMRILFEGQLLKSNWTRRTESGNEGSVLRFKSGEVIRFHRDKTLSIADPLTGEPRLRFHIPNVPLRYVVHGERNDVLVAEYRSATFPLRSAYVFFDLNSGQLISRTAEDAEEDRLNAQLSPDGRRYLSFRTAQDRPNDYTHWTELWDVATGRRIAQVRDNVLANFSPDGKWLIAYGSRLLNDGSPSKQPVNIYSPDDGRLIHSIPCGDNCFLYAAVTPSGKYLVTFTCKEVRWWRTTDWKPDGLPSQTLASDLQTIMRNMAGQGSARFENQQAPVRHVQDDFALMMGRETGPDESFTYESSGTEIHVRGQEQPIIHKGSPTYSDAAGLLLDNGHWVQFNPVRVSTPSRGSKFPPEIRALAARNRFLMPQLGGFVATIDFAAEKKTSYRIAPVRIRDRGYLVASLGSEDFRWSDLSPSMLPDTFDDFDIDLLALWVGVVTCGELNDRNLFVKWERPKWEAKREELGRRIADRPDAAFMRAAATDSLHWAYSRIGRATTARELLDLLDTLVRLEPCGDFFYHRGLIHHVSGNLDAAVADWKEALRYFKQSKSRLNRLQLPNNLSDVKPVRVDLISHLCTMPNRPREDYQFAFDWMESEPHIAVQNPFSQRGTTNWLLARYRLGNYREVADELIVREYPELFQVAQRFASSFQPQVRWLSQAALRLHAPPLTHRAFGTEHVLLSMCLHHLGRNEIAQVRMKSNAASSDDIPQELLSEARALIAGAAETKSKPLGK